MVVFRRFAEVVTCCHILSACAPPAPTVQTPASEAEWLGTPRQQIPVVIHDGSEPACIVAADLARGYVATALESALATGELERARCLTQQAKLLSTLSAGTRGELEELGVAPTSACSALGGLVSRARDC